MFYQNSKLISTLVVFTAITLISLVSVQNIRGQKAVVHENAGSYASIEWLVGNWELTIPQGLVKMTFEWGAKKSYIKYVGFNPNGEIEHEGIIVWHPDKNRIIELSAFSSVVGKGTPSEAYFEVLAKGKLAHYFTLFYPTFSREKDGKTETIAKRTVEYRQIWTRKGQDGLHDIFQTKRNGKWQLVDEKDSAGFNWKRVRNTREVINE